MGVNRLTDEQYTTKLCMYLFEERMRERETQQTINVKQERDRAMSEQTSVVEEGSDYEKEM
jgi:hypothetical protein